MTYIVKLYPSTGADPLNMFYASTKDEADAYAEKLRKDGPHIRYEVTEATPEEATEIGLDKSDDQFWKE